MRIEHNALVTSSIAHNCELLKAALKQHNIESVTVTYFGGGDSGEIEEIETLPIDALTRLPDIQVQMCKPVAEFSNGQYTYELQDVDKSLEDALRDFTMVWSEQEHGGWEIDDGGNGKMTINIPDNTCTLHHTEYFTESRQYEHSL
jgi:hypothetical protein